MDGLTNIIDYLRWLYNYTLFSSESYSLHLGNLLVGIIFFWVALRILRRLSHYLFKNLLTARVKDPGKLEWIEKFVQFLLTIILAILALGIIGVPLGMFKSFWKLTLFTIKENPVKAGNIILGLVFLYPGLRLARYLTGEIHSLFIARLNVEVATRKSLEMVIRYTLITLVVLFVLTIVGIPLTAFTIVGGALAIGVGLGSQNLVNNFLSGIVLMTERPLKVGDVVELEGRRGTVEHIGGRSTRIQTFDNLRMIIPNSKLLENTVINWTLMDDILRREVTVGVAYGSPAERVAELLNQAATEHKAVKTTPQPKILFWDFGDNALIFRLMFWVQLSRTMRPLEIESELRFAIYKLLEEAGIVIAFPQRDTHLDTLKPLEIKLLDADKEAD